MLTAISSNHYATYLRQSNLVAKDVLVHSASENLQRQQALAEPKIGVSATAELNDAAMNVVHAPKPLAELEREPGDAARPAQALNDVYSAKGLRVAMAQDVGTHIRTSA